jgi:hypothetical protein
MEFLLIFGPPAVGKMSVGNEIQKATGIPLFHNHVAIEPALRFFPFGSPAFGRIVAGLRMKIFREVAASDLPGLCFTYVWDLDDTADSDFVQLVCEIFEDAGANVTIIELQAELEQRLFRNRTEERLSEKPSKRDKEQSEQNLLALERKHRLNSDGTLPLKYRHLKIENSRLEAVDVADRIIDALELKRVDA